jgi:hypothetical protein
MLKISSRRDHARKDSRWPDTDIATLSEAAEVCMNLTNLIQGNKGKAVLKNGASNGVQWPSNGKARAVVLGYHSSEGALFE